MKISVIIAVYNEKRTIIDIIEKVKSVALEKEIIVVDDYSTDGTREILKDRFSSNNGIRLVFLDKNYGKGFAIRTALKYLTGDIVIIQDADMEYDPQDYKKLISPITKNKADVVYGSRFKNMNKMHYIQSWVKAKKEGKNPAIGHLYLSNFLGIVMLNLIVRLLYGKTITDEATCYKVFRRSVLEQVQLESMGFEFCPEVTAKVCKLGYDIYEVPILYYPRSTDHGKKISWRDGIVAIITLFKYRFID